MKYKYYDIDKKGCILRSLTKAYNKDATIIEDELIKISNELSYDDYRLVEVFERFILNNNGTKLDHYQNMLVKDLDLKGTYIIFCFKDDFYHMVTVIDNVMYDKSDETLNLSVINIYEVKYDNEIR